MLATATRNRLIECLALGGAVGLVAGLWPTALLPLTGLVVLILLLVFNPVTGLGLLLVSRSSLDIFADTPILPPPIALNPASTMGILLILLTALLVVFRVLRRAPVEWGGRLAFLWGIWLLLAGVGVLIGGLLHGGSALALGIRELVRLSSLLAVYLLVVNLARGRQGSQVITGAILLGLVVPSAVAIYQFLSGQAEHNVYGIKRLSGTFVHPNPFAIYLVAVFMAALGFWKDLTRTSRQRVWLPLVMAATLVLLVFTFSRSGFAILILALLLWASLGSRKRLLAVVGGLAVVSLVSAPVLVWRFQDLFNTAGTRVGAAPSNSWEWRMQNYYLLFHTAMESPIVGHGTRTVPLVNPVKSVSLEGYTIGAASHNELIRVLVEHGLVGVVAYLVIAISLLMALRDLIRKQRPPPEGGHPELGRAILCYLCSLFMLGMLGTEYTADTMALYVALALAGILYTGRQQTPSHLEPLAAWVRMSPRKEPAP
ncbi:MAG: O-antigen ligase family protein [Candidatus Eisenbacteria sp.]|nr:O-antigen ligase family protein [Candidatus Eisenbacteria bacterium]